LEKNGGKSHHASGCGSGSAAGMVVGAPQSLLTMPGMEMVIGEESGEVA